MPRDPGTGIAAPPPGTTISPGSDVASLPIQTLFNDLFNILNQPIPTGLLPALSFLPLSGGTLTGALVLSGDATANLNPVSLQQFNTALGTKANTSHTQTASTITDFNTASDARIAAASINALSDVTITTPTNGQALRYNGTEWVNGATGYTEYNKGAFVASTKVTQAHGLGRLPYDFKAFLRCRVADQEYSVGDYVHIGHALQDTALFYPLWMNTTEVGLSPRFNKSIYVTQKTSLGDGVFTNASWDLIFRVYS